MDLVARLVSRHDIIDVHDVVSLVVGAGSFQAFLLRLTPQIAAQNA